MGLPSDLLKGASMVNVCVYVRDKNAEMCIG